MAIILTLFSMSISCGEDLMEKFCVSPDGDGVLKTMIWNGMTEGLAVAILVFSGLSESGRTPPEIIMDFPLIFLPALLTLGVTLFSLISYMYVGVSERNTFANTYSLFYIVILAVFYGITGKGSFAVRLFHPLMIAGIALTLAAAFIYIRLYSGTTDPGDEDAKKGKGKKFLVLGISAAVISAFFDGAESVTSSVLLGDEIVDTYDYIIAWGFITAATSVILWFVLLFKEKKPYNPFRRTEKFRCISQFLCLFADVSYIFALSDDALLGILLWNAFPVLDIMGARIFMKERLDTVQYVLLAALIAGCIMISLG